MDLSIWKGDVQDFVLKMNNEQGAPLNLAGYTAQATLRQSFNSPTKYNFTCTIQNTNEVRLFMSSADCKLIPAGDYVWNFQLTYTASGDVRTYLAGDVTVFAEVDG